MAAAPSIPLAQCLPDGLIVDQRWLRSRGFSRPLVDYYLRSGTLKAVARGAYRRPGPPLKWEHVVYSFQMLGYELHVGGRSALEQQGLAHYLPMADKQLTLYGTERPPAWAHSLARQYRLEFHNPKLAKALPENALASQPFGHWDWPIQYATAELAFLELCAEATSAADFEVIDAFFEAAITLRPAVIRSLLLASSNVKANRLFLWFAYRHKHPWYQALNTEGVYLGSGKRMILRGGALDTQWLITVPRKMKGEKDDGSGSPLF